MVKSSTTTNPTFRLSHITSNMLVEQSTTGLNTQSTKDFGMQGNWDEPKASTNSYPFYMLMDARGKIQKEVQDRNMERQIESHITNINVYLKSRRMLSHAQVLYYASCLKYLCDLNTFNVGGKA